MGFNSFKEEGTRRGLLFFAAGMLCLLLAGGLVFFYSGKFSGRPSGQTAGPALSLTPPAAPEGEAGRKALPEDEGKKPWVLYITGEVSSPGVYTLSPDIRIVDLVDAAGGLTSPPGRTPYGSISPPPLRTACISTSPPPGQRNFTTLPLRLLSPPLPPSPLRRKGPLLLR